MEQSSIMDDKEGYVMENKKKLKFHYAWVIFIAGFIMVFTVLGFCSGTKGLFLAPVTADTGIPRTLFVLNDVCRYIVVGTMNLFFGIWIEKFNPRIMVAIGFINLFISQMLFSFSNSVAVFVLAGLFLGAGLAWTTTAMVGYFIGKWFTNSKGSIMGIILAVNGLGNAVASQVLSYYINSSASGWRLAYRTAAILVAIVGVIVVLLIRDDPLKMGIEPLGKNSVAKKRRTSDWTGLPFAELKKKPYFYITIACCMLYGLLLSSFTGSASAHLKDVGLSGQMVANVLSFHSILLFFGKTGTGILFDRKGLRWAINACSLAGLIAMLALTLTRSGVGAFIYGTFVGFSLPLETILMPLLAAEMFGQKAYSKTMGIMVGTVQFGCIGGTLIPNAVFDCLHTYVPVFSAFCILFIIDTIVINLMITKAHKERADLEEKELQAAGQ